jgi:hypothetical protein
MIAEHMTRTVQPARSYDAARRRRADLLRAINGFEHALAAPAAAPTWRSRVGDQLAALGQQLAEHVTVTEGADGLYAELLEYAPRLTRQVAGLVGDHTALRRQIESLANWLRDPATGVEELRGSATDLLVMLARHRQRGADLVYEAYATDIGGET